MCHHCAYAPMGNKFGVMQVMCNVAVCHHFDHSDIL